MKIMHLWKSRKFCTVFKSAMAAETLFQVKATEACFWLTNFLSQIFYCKPSDEK